MLPKGHTLNRDTDGFKVNGQEKNMPTFLQTAKSLDWLY